MKTVSTKIDPLVSIILCTYNRAHLVKRAIASVLIQTYRNWELIIIDDGSTDGTENILLPLVKSDSRLSYLRHANKGLARSRNVGSGLAKGEFITFLDSDDEYREDHLAHRVELSQSRKSVALWHGGIEYVGPEEKQYVPDARHVGKKIHLDKCYASATFFATAGFFKKLGGFRNVAFAEDFDLVTRLRKRGMKIARVSKPTYRYHLDTDNRLCDLYEQGGEEAIRTFRGVLSIAGSV
ncbi:MAG: glycosyltransferase family 2 protein [Ignavibacteriae bacterium]|nr:glycosyltransferase family 2 protein [Ignavibacteriota bacterium]MCI0707920.1 glycosyltransferase family 2 protein [Ignavibacteriota bacterium]